MNEGLRSARLIALFVAGWAVFDFPLLQLWASPVALFVVWAVLIGLLAWIMERSGE